MTSRPPHPPTAAPDAPSREGGPERAGTSGRLLLWLLLVAALIRLPLLFVEGYWYDVLHFRRWAAAAYDNGLSHVFDDPDIDYVGFAYILWLLAAIADLFASGPLSESKTLLQAVKLPGFVGDLAATALLFWVTRRFLQLNPTLAGAKTEALLRRLPLLGEGRLATADRAGLLAAALYAFNPATLYSSGYWGQTDSLLALFMLAAVAALLERRVVAASVVLTVGFLVKPQAIVLAPLLAFAAWRSRRLEGILRSGGAALATFVVGLSYFLAKGGFDRVRDVYEMIFFDPGARVSVSAWNLWNPFQRYGEAQPKETMLSLLGEPVSYEDASRLLLLLALGVALVYLRRSRDPLTLFVAASYLVFAFFMLPMKIHERYLFPLFVLLAPAAVLERRWLFFYAALSLTFTLNLSALYPLEDDLQRFMHEEFAMVVTALNIALFLAFSALLLRPEVEARLEPLRRLWIGASRRVVGQFNTRSS